MVPVTTEHYTETPGHGRTELKLFATKTGVYQLGI